MNDIKITLPDEIYFLQTIPDSISNSMNEEFSIYYENIIYPYSDFSEELQRLSKTTISYPALRSSTQV